MKGVVSGVYTNDMDALVFGSKTLLYELKVIKIYENRWIKL